MSYPQALFDAIDRFVGSARPLMTGSDVKSLVGLKARLAPAGEDGRMWTTLLSAVLGTTLGPAWLSTGTFAVSFTRMVKAGDRITAHAVVTASDAEPEGRRVHFEVWCENQRGERGVTGSASCLAPGQPRLRT